MPHDPRIETKLTDLPEPVIDNENPEWTASDFARARPTDEVLPPGVFEAFPRAVARARGPQRAPTKKQVTLRLDREVIAHFQVDGPGWQSRINTALRRAIGKAS